MSCKPISCEVISTGGGPGNAVLVNGTYLFDCGVRFAKLKPYLKQISIVFLTHIHGDHFKAQTIYKLHRARPGIRFVCSSNLVSDLVIHAHVSLRNIVVITPEKSPRVIPGAFAGEWVEVNTFPLLHDVENVGYVIRVTGSDGDGSAMYATDTHHIPINAPDLDLYMIEANYTREEIRQRIARKEEAGEFAYESRVMETHMSLETAMEWLHDNADHTRSRIVFLHGHQIEEEGGTRDYAEPDSEGKYP